MFVVLVVLLFLSNVWHFYRHLASSVTHGMSSTSEDQQVAMATHATSLVDAVCTGRLLDSKSAKARISRLVTGSILISDNPDLHAWTKATWFNGAISHWCLCVLKFWYQVQRVRNLETSDEVCTRWCDSVSWQTGQLRKDGKDKVKVRSCCAQLFEHRLHINSCQNVVVAYYPFLTLSGSSFKTKVFQVLEFQKCGTREPLRESWGLVYIKMFGCRYTVVF